MVCQVDALANVANASLLDILSITPLFKPTF